MGHVAGRHVQFARGNVKLFLAHHALTGRDAPIRKERTEALKRLRARLKEHHHAAAAMEIILHHGDFVIGKIPSRRADDEHLRVFINPQHGDCRIGRREVIGFKQLHQRRGRRFAMPVRKQRQRALLARDIVDCRGNLLLRRQADHLRAVLIEFVKIRQLQLLHPARTGNDQVAHLHVNALLRIALHQRRVQIRVDIADGNMLRRRVVAAKQIGGDQRKFRLRVEHCNIYLLRKPVKHALRFIAERIKAFLRQVNPHAVIIGQNHAHRAGKREYKHHQKRRQRITGLRALHAPAPFFLLPRRFSGSACFP